MKRISIVALGLLLCSAGWSQEQSGSMDNKGQLHGNVQALFQNYNPDEAIGAQVPDAKAAMNTFGNFTYTYGQFTAGMRFESYHNAILGFPNRFKGSGIGSRYVRYNADNIDITVGNFYEQFGNGLSYRTYWEPNLGIDNAMDGVRVIFKPVKGVALKAVYGQQRFDFDSRIINGAGIVRGIDGELSVNELVKPWAEKPLKVTLGGSFVSKYQSGETFVRDFTLFNLPNNVGASAGRLGLVYKNIQVTGEYVTKINDPNADNNYIFKKGESIFLNAAFSKKGFGITASGKYVDNMAFRSDRDALLFDVPINFLPAITRQHTYNLAATLYPYATVLNGEVGVSGELFYTFKKESALGGKYGTYISLNVAAVNSLDTSHVGGRDELVNGYKVNSYSFGDTKYVRDVNFEIRKKINKEWNVNLIHYYFEFNTKVTPVTQDFKGLVYAHIDVLDIQYKFKPKHSIRAELQSLVTEQDKGNWATALVEYTFSPHWSFAVMDQYNYGNTDAEKRVHYLYGNLGYSKGASRIMIGYGKRRAGIFCIGGVCRAVPASNGIEINLTSSF
jgi:predicted secreted protein